MEFNATENARISKITPDEGLYIYSDLCKGSIAYGEQRALLRCLEKNARSKWDYILDNPFYLDVSKNEIRNFEIYIKRETNVETTHLMKPVHLTLRLKKLSFLVNMKLYVPNPQLWVDFFHRVSRSKASLQQTGRGRFPSAIEGTPSSSPEEKKVAINAVLPTKQITAQAKAQLEREQINPKQVENVFQSLTELRTSNKKRKFRDSANGEKKRRKTQTVKGKVSRKKGE